MKVIYTGKNYHELFPDRLKFNGSNIESECVRTVNYDTIVKLGYRPDMVVADYNSADSQWLEVMAALRKADESIPFVVLGTDDSEDAPIQSFRHGADDYIPMAQLSNLPAILFGLFKQRPAVNGHSQLNKANTGLFHPNVDRNQTSHHSNIGQKSAAPGLELSNVILDTLPVNIAVLDMNGIIISVNQTWINFARSNQPELQTETFIGWDYLEVCKSSITDDDEYAARVYDGMSRLLDGEISEFELEYPCHSPGANRWFILHASKLKGTDNVIVSHTDISARKTAEHNLKTSELKFRSLLEQNRDGMALLDSNLKPVYCSPSIVNILGYSANEILDIDLISLAHPDDIPVMGEVMKFALANPGIPTKPKVTRMRAKSGEWKYIEGTLTNMLHDPLINAVVDNFRDVTEKKLAHDQLVNSNRLYAIICRVNQITARTKDEAALYNEVCNIIIELGGYDFAWIGLTNADGIVEMVANTGMIDCDIAYFNNYVYNSHAPVKGVLDGRERHSVISLENLPRQTECSAGSKCFSSAICFPLKRSGKVIGTFNLYTGQHQIFSDDEISLLTEVANEMSFALEIIEKEKFQKMTVRELAIKNAKLSRAQSIAHLGTWEVDLERELSTWSKEMLAIYGLPSEQVHIPYEKWLSMVHPEDYLQVAECRERALASKEGFSITHRIIRSDGAVREILSQLEFDRDSRGAPTTLIGVSQDITDNKQITEALEASEKAFMQSENRYRQIVELANEGIILLNGRNQIVFANERMISMTGYSSDELFGRDLLSLLDTRDKAEAAVVYRKFLSNEPGVFEACITSKTGKSLWTSVASSHIDERSGGFNGTIALISDISARRQAEQENAFKACILNNIGQAVVATDKKGAITYWNKAAQKLYNIKSDILGKDLARVSPAYLTNFHRKMWETVKSKNIWSHEIQIKESYNNFHTCLIRAEPILDDRNVFSGVTTITTDISEQRRLKKLLESSVRLAKLGHFELNLENNVLFWSAMAKEIYEVRPDYEPELDAALEFFKGDSHVAIKKVIEDAIHKGNDWDIELLLTTAKSIEKWVRVIGEVDLHNGKPWRIYGSVQDVTAHKLSEVKVFNAYQERNSILESIGEAFFAVDRNWSVNYWNTNAERILLKKRQDVLGKNFWGLYPEYLDSSAHERYVTAMETGEVVEFEEFFFTFQKWLQVSVFPSELGLSIFFKDVTERKLTEIHLQELNENLQTYTADLMAVNRELEQFSYIVSHNLRAPVTNILGIAEELTDESYDYHTKTMFVESLKLSAKRLDEVIGDLNNVLQLKAGVIEKKELVNLNQFSRSALDGIDNLIRQQEATVITDFGAAPEIQTVKRYLHSIFYNLITNAIKYRRQAIPPVISIKSAIVTDGIELTFTDNGLGLDVERKRKELFGMYQRFHSHVDGKGIGLFMVKTQVDILGGTIAVESELNKGTTFRIFIPEKPSV